MGLASKLQAAQQQQQPYGGEPCQKACASTTAHACESDFTGSAKKSAVLSLSAKCQASFFSMKVPFRPGSYGSSQAAPGYQYGGPITQQGYSSGPISQVLKQLAKIQIGELHLPALLAHSMRESSILLGM